MPPDRSAHGPITRWPDAEFRVDAEGVDAVEVDVVVLARYKLAAEAPQRCGNLAEPRHTATLLATARHLEATAVTAPWVYATVVEFDDCCVLFDVLMAIRLISAPGLGLA